MDSNFGQLTEDIYASCKGYENNMIDDAQFNKKMLMNINVLIKTIINKEQEEYNEDNSKEKVDVFLPSGKMQQRIESVINPINNDGNDIDFGEFDDSMEMDGDHQSMQIPNDQWDIESIRKQDDEREIISSIILPSNNSQGNNSLSNSFDEAQYKELADMTELSNTERSKIKDIAKEMGLDYIASMKTLYNKLLNVSDDNKEIPESLRFSHQFKKFILSIGLSEKKFYEQSIREIIYYKKSFSFYDFLQCFSKLFQMRQEYTFLKYNFLLHITPRGYDNYFRPEELEKFYSLIHAKRIRDNELENEIKEKFLLKYQYFYPNANEPLYLKRLSLVLESFFDFK